MSKASRRDQRELSFVLLFEQAVTGEDMEVIIDNARESRDVVLGTFAEELVKGATENSARIDEVISENIRGWSMSRLSKVAVSILRVSVFELMYDAEIPVSVSINEAVELAKKYGGKDDSSYINGVLSSIAKSDNICKKNNE